MSVATATTVASTIFSYFNPAKSPFYAVITFGALGLVLSRGVEVYFFAVSIPIVLILFVATMLSFGDRSKFTAEEYNNQIKFSRSVGISVAVLCLVFLGRDFGKLTGGNGSDSVAYFAVWAGYAASVVQATIYLAYIFIYYNHESHQRGANIIQISLIICTYLVAATVMSIVYPTSDIQSIVILVTLYGYWALCAIYMVRYLKANFRLQAPRDAAGLVSDDDGNAPAGANGTV